MNFQAPQPVWKRKTILYEVHYLKQSIPLNRRPLCYSLRSAEELMEFIFKRDGNVIK